MIDNIQGCLINFIVYSDKAVYESSVNFQILHTNFIFPIDLEKGVNELRLEHPGRRSNKLYTITIAKEIN